MAPASGSQRWKLWASLGIVAWAGALHWNLRALQATPAFKEKFPELAKEEEGPEKEASSWQVRLRGAAAE
jgi:hypothetical protein